jgi:diketogulonate reductase-like aldo/keto reductase
MNRRNLIKYSTAAACGISLPLSFHKEPAAKEGLIKKRIPSSGDMMPVIGLGSWITFNVGNDPVLLDECADVIAAFSEGGGAMIDSSPMYGSSQDTIGYGLAKLAEPERIYSAEKVWTSNADEGPEQIEQSRSEWGVDAFDLMQVHNLVAWQAHLETLFSMKAAGELRHVGITTSHGRRHVELLRIMEQHPIDFVQLTYNILDREAEDELLPLAKEKGIAVIANRPFRTGRLLKQLGDYPLPPTAEVLNMQSWAQFVLKFIISHPEVTCVIPATTRVDHIKENLQAGTGVIPDPDLRDRMAREVTEL